MLQVGSMIIGDISEYLESFNFIFNKFDDKTDIGGVVGNIWKSVKKSDDAMLKLLIESLLDKCDNEEVIKLNPLEEKPLNIMKKLEKGRAI